MFLLSLLVAGSLFLSTLSLRRATGKSPRRCVLFRISIHALLAESDKINPTNQTNLPGISIHALLAESDNQQPAGTTSTTYFYPRSPCGERRNQHDKHHPHREFLSTLSLRRATGPWSAGQSRRCRFLSTLSLRRATAKVHKTVGHFCAYETNFMEIASSC